MPTRSGPNRLRYPALRGGVVVDTYRGKVRVRKWPRPRGKRLHPHTAYMNKWFRDACHKIAYADARAVDYAIKATKGTGLYPRDVLMAGMGAGLVNLVLPDGTPITHKRQGLHPVAFQGCRLQKTALQNILASTATALVWPLPVIDTAGMFNLGFPTRITIPAGINIVRLTAGCRANVATNTTVNLWIFKNGTTLIAEQNSNAAPWTAAGVDSGPLPVAAGDYFEVFVFLSAIRNIINGPPTRFSTEILDADYPA